MEEPGMDDNTFRYLEIAYEEVDGSPFEEVSSQQIGRKLGVDDDRQRRIERDLINQGLLQDAGADSFRLRLPAIHHVEEQWLEEGRKDVVDERRKQRGDYVRELYQLADEDPSIAVPVPDLQEQLPFAAQVERRTREYLAAAGLIEVDEDRVTLTKQGAEWALQASDSEG